MKEKTGVLQVKSIAGFYEAILSNPNIPIAPRSAEWVAELEQAYDIIYEKLPIDSIFRGFHVLAPVVTFMFFKMSAVFINTPNYLEHVDIERSVFLFYLKKISPLHEEYSLRNRWAYIDNVIKSVAEFLDLGSEFESLSQEILKTFISQLKNMAEEMIAAMVCVLSKITLDKKKLSLSKIYRHVGVGASSINAYFKKTLAKPILGADEFKGFVKSSELIKVNCLKILESKKKAPKKPIIARAEEKLIEKKPIKKKIVEKKPIEKKEKVETPQKRSLEAPVEKKLVEKKPKDILPSHKEINFKDVLDRLSKNLYIDLESELLEYLEGVPGISIDLISLMTSDITEKSLNLFSKALKNVKLLKKE